MLPTPEQVQEVFLKISALPPNERQAALDRECAGQPELAARVAELLAAHDEANSFLDKTVDGVAPTQLQEAMASEGTVIADRYTLRERIGEGGMGEVWVAKQTEPVNRRVALKLIKTGMDSRAMLARFEQERQALAMMDHPNIARVLDGGLTPTGQPFFVMELVNGLPLTQFCDEAKLSLKQRLELFVPICQAIQHAHQKGIVHRDLKPANILVTMVDGRPVPKTIDFGVAKALSGNLTEHTLTQFGAVVGTLEYMSPEQASFSGTDVDTRADIYSLGVILYELLTGLKPIDKIRLKDAALTEMIRVIREEEPSKPSTRLSTDDSATSMAALRQTEPHKLMALLRGELDWVVMKCLEKDRERRYETANALVRDVQRYLTDEPVEARPPSSGYRLRKFLKRNKGPAIAVSLMLLTLIAGITGTTWGLFEARRQTEIARGETAKKDAALQAETAARQEAEKQTQLAIEARKNETAAKEVAQRQTELAHEAVDKYLNTVTEDPQLKYDNFHDLRKKLLETAIPFYEEFAAADADDPKSKSDQAAAYHRLAVVQYELGERKTAGDSLQQMQNILTKLVEQFPTTPDYQHQLAQSHLKLAMNLKAISQYDAAREQFELSVKHLVTLAERFPDVPDYQRTLVTSRTGLAILLKDLGELKPAIEQLRRCAEIGQSLAKRFPEADDQFIICLNYKVLADVLMQLGDHEAAKVELLAGLESAKSLTKQFPDPPRHQQVRGTLYCSLGNLLRGLNELEEARNNLQAALGIRQALEQRFPDVVDYQVNLSTCQSDLGKVLLELEEPAGAKEQFLAAQRSFTLLAERHPDVPNYHGNLAATRSNLAKVMMKLDEPERAKTHLTASAEGFDLLAAKFPEVPQHQSNAAISHRSLGGLLRRLSNLENAKKQYQIALKTIKALVTQFPAVPQYQQTMRDIYNDSAIVLIRLREFEEAKQHFAHALEISESLVQSLPNLPFYQNQLNASYRNLARFLVERRHLDEARKLLQDGVTRFPENQQIHLLSRQVEVLDGAIPGAVASWSPDGQSLVFKEQSEKGHDDLVIVTRDGMEQRTLVEGKPADHRDSLWSAKQGGPIIFVRRFDNRPYLWRVDPDGSNMRELTPGIWPAGWSVDGNRLYFRDQNQQRCVFDFLKENAEPEKLMVLDDHRNYPAISPDETMLARHSDGHLVITELDSGEVVAKWPVEGWEAVFPGWSPDSRFVAFGSYDSGNDEGKGLWILDHKRGEAFQALPDVGTIPRWSPDGNQIVVDLRGIGSFVKILDVVDLPWPESWDDAPRAKASGSE